MTATKGLGTYGNGVGTVTPLDHKMAQLGLFVKTAANTIRPGVFWDGNTTVVSGKANMSYDVRPLAAVLSRGATSGAVLLTNDGVVNVVTTAAPGSNSRYDVVYLWQREFALDGTDSNPVIGVVQGTAAASPTVPSLSGFPGAIELARIIVPAGITATTSATITQTAPFTTVDGGTIPFRNTTERDAWSGVVTPVTRQRARDISTGIEYVWNGTAWASPTILASGSLSAVSSFNIDGLTGASGYEIIINLPTASAANSLACRVRASGTADTSANYDIQRSSGAATTATASSTMADTQWATIEGGSRVDKWYRFTVYSLNQAERTIIDFAADVSDATASPVTARGYMRHRSASMFDGLGFTVSTGTVTGRYEVRAL